MDLEKFYNEYWEKKEDEIDHNRLNLIVKCIESGKKVLEINCGLGILAEKIAKKGADITVTDLSDVALQKARSRGISKGFKIDIDKQQLPINLPRFDIVVSNSMIEHSFFPENTIREGVKVLNDGGHFIILVPNIGHWRFRLSLILGNFPYLQNTPTDILHLRFFTMYSLKKMGEKFGLKVKKVSGNSGLWVNDIYPSFFRITPIKQIYEELTSIYPSLFARDVLIIFQK